ncbi:MAG: cyclic nucleotide-binding and patatin-like phospholipase domain-containing protein [Chloroflexota bacterium]
MAADLFMAGLEALITQTEEPDIDKSNGTKARTGAKQPIIQMIELVNAFNWAFGEMGQFVLDHLEGDLTWLSLSHGDLLIRQGDRDASLYIVISGRLNVVIEQPNGQQRIINTVGRGECIGESALLTGNARSASIYAIRDTVVVKLAKPDFDRLINEHPEVMGQLMPHLINRLQRSNEIDAYPAQQTSTIAIIPLDQSKAVSKFVKQLVTALNCLGSTLHINSHTFDSDISHIEGAQISRNHPASLVLETWLSEQEAHHQYLIFEADQDWSSWSQRCIRNADRILLVGRASGDPHLKQIEKEMHAALPDVPSELILLYPKNETHPKNTSRWLKHRRIQTHHHVRLNQVEDLQSLARRLTGQAIGLVLGGGAARGIAHIGVIRAIREAGIPIDVIGGTSIGSIVGATYALGWNYEAMVEAVQSFLSARKILDLTLPIVSMAAGRKMSKTLATEFDGIQIEDLWIPYFCLSSNLTKAKPEVHSQGQLWRYMRASCTLPGLITPLVENGELLVDGGVLNNLPIDVMRDMCRGGTVIAVDVSAETTMNEDYQFNASLSGWRVLWSKLNPFKPAIKAPTLIDTLMRSMELSSVYQKSANKSLADLYINPPVGHFSAGAFEEFQSLIEIGYQTGKKTITAWLEAQVESKNATPNLT